MDKLQEILEGYIRFRKDQDRREKLLKQAIGRKWVCRVNTFCLQLDDILRENGYSDVFIYSLGKKSQNGALRGLLKNVFAHMERNNLREGDFLDFLKKGWISFPVVINPMSFLRINPYEDNGRLSPLGAFFRLRTIVDSLGENEKSLLREYYIRYSIARKYGVSGFEKAASRMRESLKMFSFGTLRLFVNFSKLDAPIWDVLDGKALEESDSGRSILHSLYNFSLGYKEKIPEWCLNTEGNLDSKIRSFVISRLGENG